MFRKDYYLVLGIPRSETAAGIRAAYRDLAKRHHPDIVGSSGAGRFRDITEAYEVLSDPVRRRRHNDDLAESESIQRPGGVRATAEQLVPPAHSIFGSPDAIRLSFDELFDRYPRNFTGIGVQKAERAEGLNMEVILTPEEASRGGVLPVTVPVFHECPTCRGTGEDWPFPCLECGGQGLIELQEAVHIKIPAGVRPATVIELPLRGLGVHNFYLRVHIGIGGPYTTHQ